MNNLEMDLIQYVYDNNIIMARKAAKAVIINDKTKKSADFCSRMIARFEALEAKKNIDVPSTLKTFLVVEEPVINENRYYLSSRKKELLNKIIKLKGASEKLAEVGINYVNSTLLCGESGTGKTTFGKFLAYKLSLPFIYINFSYIIDSYLGKTQNNIAKVFDFIRTQECVFMIDEIDALGSRRGSRDDVGEMSRVTISLMQALDSLNSKTILLAATNRIDIIDEALLRRFTIKHELTRLDLTERTGLVRNFFNDVGYTYTEDLIEQLCKDDKTQGSLMNDMIMILVNHFSEDDT